MVRTKVFVGNLDFRTREAELAKAFAVAGKVISANIITRGPRSLGYGFVEFDNEEDANNAVKTLNKSEVDGRPINVEVAKAREELQQQQQQQTDNKAQSDDQSAPADNSARGGRGGRGGRGRGRGGRGARGTRGGARGGGVYRKTSSAGKQEQQPAENKPQQQAQKQEKKEKEPDNRTPSKTLLFVANLPFKLDDNTFGQIFKDAGVTYKNAYVVKNQRSGRSKGFGFAEFENEADQQKALNAVNGKTVEERALVVKVALTEAPQPAKKPEENKAASPAPAQKQ